MSSYATLGQSCQCSLAVLTDNRKFFPLNEPDYNLIFTKNPVGGRYPGPSNDQLPTIDPSLANKQKRPEELKTGTDSLQQAENFNHSEKSFCCGRK